MSRAEIRRAQKEREKKPAVYNFTEAQLKEIISNELENQLKIIREEAIAEAANQALILMFGLPLKVLMDYYWPKTYAKKFPGFVKHLLEYYSQWQDGELDIDEVREELWEYGGVRFEEEGDITESNG